MPSLHSLPSFKLMSLVFTCSRALSYLCLSCLALSNGATFGIIGGDLNAIVPEFEEEETPQQLAKWTPDDVF